MGGHPLFRLANWILSVVGFVVLVGIVLSFFVTQVSVGARTLAQDALGFTTQLQLLQKDKEALNNQISEFKIQLSDQKQNIDKLTTQLQTSNTEKVQIEQDRATDIKSLNDQITQLQQGQGLNELNQKISTLTSKLSQDESVIADLRTQLAKPCQTGGTPSQPGAGTTTPGGTTTPSTSGDVLFIDDFSSKKNDWSLQGSFEISDGALSGKGGKGSAFLVTGKEWLDYAVDVDATYDSHSTFQVIIRATDSKNYASLKYYYGTLHLCSYVDEEEKNCDTYSPGYSSSSHIRLEVQGTKITAYLNQAPVAKIQGGFPVKGYPGLYAYDSSAITFDNFKVTKL